MAKKKKLIKLIGFLKDFYTIDNLAYELGVSSSTVYKWQRGEACSEGHYKHLKDLLELTQKPDCWEVY